MIDCKKIRLRQSASSCSNLQATTFKLQGNSTGHLKATCLNNCALAWIAVTLRNVAMNLIQSPPMSAANLMKWGNTIQEYTLLAICFLKRESSLAYFLSFKRQQDYRMHTVTTNVVVPSSPVFPQFGELFKPLKA